MHIIIIIIMLLSDYTVADLDSMDGVLPQTSSLNIC